MESRCFPKSTFQGKLHHDLVFYSDSMTAYLNIKKNYLSDITYGYQIDTFHGAQTLRFPLNDQIQNNTSRTLIEITGYPVDSLDAYFNDAHKDILSEKY